MERKNLKRVQRARFIKRIVKLVRFSQANGFKAEELDVEVVEKICEQRCGFYVRVDANGQESLKGGIVVGKELYYEFELRPEFIKGTKSPRG